MRKKVILFLCLCILLCGCQNIKDLSKDEIINKITKKVDNYNVFHTGYKYYVPKGMQVSEYILYNDVISTNKYNFYMYVDVISYFNKTTFKYEENKNSHYSKQLKNDNKYGYIEINLKENNQYLIEIMYNYAKIEVMVDYDDINLALNYAVSILRSVQYSDKIIANIMGDDILSYQEEVYDIFKNAGKDSNILEGIQDIQPEVDNNEIKDTDLIN